MQAMKNTTKEDLPKVQKTPKWLRNFGCRYCKKTPIFQGHDFIIKGSGRPEEFLYRQLMCLRKEA